VSSYGKRKGATFETSVMKWLRSKKVFAERLTKAGLRERKRKSTTPLLVIYGMDSRPVNASCPTSGSATTPNRANRAASIVIPRLFR